MLVSESDKLCFIHRLCLLSYKHEKSSASQIIRVLGKGKSSLRNLSCTDIVDLVDKSNLFTVDNEIVFYDSGDPEDKTLFYFNSAYNTLKSNMDPGAEDLPDFPINVEGSKGSSVYMMIPGFVYKHQTGNVLTTMLDGTEVFHILFNCKEEIPAGLALASLRFVLNSEGNLVCIVEKLNLRGQIKSEIICHVRSATIPRNFAPTDVESLDSSFQEFLSALFLKNNNDGNLPGNLAVAPGDVDDNVGEEDLLPPLLATLSLDNIVTV